MRADYRNPDFMGPHKTGFTKEEIAHYRKLSPGGAGRSLVNGVGPKYDPVYGYPVTKFEAGHIVSFDELIKTPMLPLLPKNDILTFLNNNQNFIGLGKRTNASMQNKTFVDWPGHSKLGPVPDSVRQKMINKEIEARSVLFKDIMMKINNGN